MFFKGELEQQGSLFEGSFFEIFDFFQLFLLK